MSGGIEEKKPGDSRLVHDTFSGTTQDMPGPGKRTLIEQLTGAPVQRKAGADGGRDLSFGRYEERSFNRYEDLSFDPTSVQRKAASSASDPGDQVHAAAEHGISGSSSPLAKHTPHAARHEPGPHIAPATPGIDKAGFIDNGSGAPLYNRPPEAGGELLRAAPLPPTARVFVSGTYPTLSDWWYVTAYLEQTMVRGYVERVRVAADLPEPLAELRQLTGGETAEGLAKEKYHEAVRDGHDLRYYENVLLYVNQQHHRKGVIGAYQDPGVAGNGSNNVQLVAGHRIWLVSPAYAKALESVVPSGSLTGGAVAKAKRFMGHLEDILKSVTESVHHVDEVAGEYAQAIRDHMASIIGITAGFITAEAISMFAAATPTGVGQAVAVVIQLALAAFGAAGMVEAGLEAMKHGNQWLTTAWTAKGDSAKILEASKEFLQMLVTLAVAALSYAGAKGNYRNALKVASSMPTGGLPALATAGGHASGGAAAKAGVEIVPGVGGIGAAGAQMTKHHAEGGGSEIKEPPRGEKPPTRAEAEVAAKHAKNYAREPHDPPPHDDHPATDLEPGSATPKATESTTLTGDDPVAVGPKKPATNTHIEDDSLPARKSNGKFVDAELEQRYQDYRKRKKATDEHPRGRNDWKERVDWWRENSPAARGHKFNKSVAKRKLYTYNEVHLEDGTRLDSYEHDGHPERISRKATDFLAISDGEFKAYLAEIEAKYPKGKKIRSNKYPNLNGKRLRGDAVLEVPLENLDPKDPKFNDPALKAKLDERRARFEQLAADAGVELRYTSE